MEDRGSTAAVENDAAPSASASAANNAAGILFTAWPPLTRTAPCAIRHPSIELQFAPALAERASTEEGLATLRRMVARWPFFFSVYPRPMRTSATLRTAAPIT